MDYFRGVGWFGVEGKPGKQANYYFFLWADPGRLEFYFVFLEFGGTLGRLNPRETGLGGGGGVQGQTAYPWGLGWFV